MSIVFILPRQHTNLNGILEEMKQRQYRITSLCLNLWDEEKEAHDLLLPEKIQTSWTSKIISGMFSKSRRNVVITPSLSYVFRKLRMLRPDCMIIREPYLATSFVFILIGLMLRVRMIIYTQWSFEISKDRIPFYRWMKLLNERMKINFYTTLPPAGHGLQTLKNFYYVPFALKVKLQRSRNYFIGDRLNILLVSKMQPRKRIEDVIYALQNLSIIDRISFKIVSRRFDIQYENMIREMIVRLELSNTVEIILDVPYQDMDTYYLQSDLFVFPAEKEPCSVSQFEAMAAGNAVLISDDNYLTDYIVKNGAGMSFRNRDVDDLKAKLEEFGQNRALISRFGEQGLKVIKDNHNPGTVVDRLVELCQ